MRGRKPLGEKSKVQLRENEEITCRFNTGVICTRKETVDVYICSHCGWNPDEVVRRKQTNDQLRAI